MNATVSQRIARWFVDLVLLVVAVGWLANLFFLFTRDETMTQIILRIVGVVLFPLGMILGYFT